MYIDANTDKAITRKEALRALMKEDERLTRDGASEYLDKIEQGGRTVEIGLRDQTAYLWLPVTEEEYRQEKFFEDEGRRLTFLELMAENAGDPELWDWALKANVGDTTPGYHLTRVA